MGDRHEPPLPKSVQAKLEEICSKQGQEQPKSHVRRRLANIGEDASLQLLDDISKSPIRNLGAFINYKISNYYQPSSPSPASSAESGNFGSTPPRASPASSVNSSPQMMVNETSYSRVTRSQTFSPSSSVVQRSPLFDYQTTPPRNQQSIAELRDISSSSNAEFGESSRPQADNSDSKLSKLSQLEFQKFFLLLSYAGKQKLEDVLTTADVEDILSHKDLPMGAFESHIWSVHRHCFLEQPDRLQRVDWDSGKAHLYFCHINPDGSRIFKGPSLNAAGTHLQREVGDDNVLIVKFSQEATDCSRSIVREGILVGLRRYHFFVYKDGGREKKQKSKVKSKDKFLKCYFVHIDSLGLSRRGQTYTLTGKTVHDARCLFMHVHMVSSMAKYMARFSLILSKSVKLPIDLSTVDIQIIEDMCCLDVNGSVVCDRDGEPLILSDGTGYISEDLAAKCPKNFHQAKYSKVNNYEEYLDTVNGGLRSIDISDKGAQALEYPLLMQCRLFYNGCAVKGTLLVNRKLPSSTIQIRRRSMIKVETDTRLIGLQTFNSLEIVAISRKPRRTLLSKFLIALLSYGGVPREFFLGLLRTAVADSKNICTDEYTALKVAERYAERDDVSFARNMILADIPLHEPYLCSSLSTMAKEERSGLREGRLPVDESYYVMGTVDPTHTLSTDEVCVILGNGQISGEVLVYRNPGLHFGDIHRLTAVYVRSLEEIVGNAKYAIFFSAKGQRSVASELADGDFDGDLYWVSQNPELLKSFKASKPWERMYSTDITDEALQRKPSELSAKEMELVLFQQFLEDKTLSYSMSTASDSWLAFMDRLLTLGADNVKEKERLKEKMLYLIDLYYDALDAPKSAKRVVVPRELKADKYPHYMGKKENLSYRSVSILGEIYDTAEELSRNQERLAIEIWKLPCFDVEIPKDCLKMWRTRYNEYRLEMSKACSSGSEVRTELADEVIRKYKELLYGAPELHSCRRGLSEIRDEALAIYHVTYDHAKSVGDVKRCGFAWKIAGPVLCCIYVMSQGEIPMACSPAAMRKIL